MSQVDSSCHGQPFATAQTDMERDGQKGAMSTRGSSALPPTRGNPEETGRYYSWILILDWIR